MCRNLRKLLAMAALLTLLAGCGAEAAGQALLLTEVQQQSAQRKLVQAKVDDLERTSPGFVACQVIYAQDQLISCRDLKGYVMEACKVSQGDVVKEGQCLAVFRLPEDARRQEQLQNELRTAELQLQAASEAADRAVSAAETALASAPKGTNQEKICRLQLESAQAAQAAVSETEVQAARQAIADYEAAVAGVELTAPFDGMVENVLRATEKPLTGEENFCRLYSYDRVYLRAEGVNDPSYRYGAEVKLYKGGKFFCSGTVISSMEVYGRSNGTVVVRPGEDVDLGGLRETSMGLTLSAVRLQLEDVLLLPKQAVRQDDGEYYVYLQHENALCRRYVQVGAEGRDSQGQTCLQILDGIEAGDWVIAD